MVLKKLTKLFANQSPKDCSKEDASNLDYFTIEYTESELGPSFSITVVAGNQAAFKMEIPRNKISDPLMREAIIAWVLGLYSIPGIRISKSCIESLLDRLEERFPIEKPLCHRPRIKIW